MLTRFVRIQLAIFTTVAVIGMAAMTVLYVQAPTLLGIGKMTVQMTLPTTGGLYRFSNVTYRGVQIGKVTAVRATESGATATLSIDDSAKIPSDLQAEVRSVSAVGEQYVDLRPRTNGAPYLRDGSVIAVQDTAVPQPVGPMLDKVSALVGSIPKERFADLLDESYRGFNGAGDDFGSLLDSSAAITHDFNSVAEQTRSLIEDSGPLLEGQTQTADAIRVWADGLAGVTGQLVDDDAAVRTILRTGPGFAQEVSRLLTQVKPTLPVLLANLATVGQVAVTYHASVEQLLVLLPPYVASLNTVGGTNNPYGLAMGDFALTVADPPACTVGFLPPSAWRSPADLSETDTPDGLYCKLPQDSAIAVRGARNYPCIEHPGKRAPTVEICNSDKPFMPLAQRQHLLGPYPLDPSQISQGIPPDSRVNPDAEIYGPIEGTPPPPGSAPLAVPPSAADVPASAEPLPPPSPDPAVTPVAPNSFATGGAGASVAVAEYDPHSGKYAAPDGQVFSQSDLAAPGAKRTWQQLVLG